MEVMAVKRLTSYVTMEVKWKLIRKSGHFVFLSSFARFRTKNANTAYKRTFFAQNSHFFISCIWTSCFTPLNTAMHNPSSFTGYSAGKAVADILNEQM